MATVERPSSTRRRRGIVHVPVPRVLRGRSAMLARGAARGAWWRLRGPKDAALVGLTQHIGDLVAAEPVARYLKSAGRRPVTWAVRQDLANIVSCFDAVDDVLPLNSLTEWCGMRRVAGRVVDLHVSGSWCERHLHRLRRDDCPVTRATYYDQPSLLHAFAAASGLPAPQTWGIDLTPRLSLPPSAARAADGLGLPGAFVAIHCRSNQVERDWPEQRWVELARRLTTELGVPVVEVGLASVCGAVPGVIDVCGRTDVLGTAAVLERARLFVGIDSGPAHLAQALGPEAVLLLGAFHGFARYMPHAGRYAAGAATVLQHAGPVAELPVDAVFDACAERFAR